MDASKKASEGTVLKGTVKRLTDFGAFVEVLPDVEFGAHFSVSHESTLQLRWQERLRS